MTTQEPYCASCLALAAPEPVATRCSCSCGHPMHAHEASLRAAPPQVSPLLDAVLNPPEVPPRDGVPRTNIGPVRAEGVDQGVRGQQERDSVVRTMAMLARVGCCETCDAVLAAAALPPALAPEPAPVAPPAACCEHAEADHRHATIGGYSGPVCLECFEWDEEPSLHAFAPAPVAVVPTCAECGSADVITVLSWQEGDVLECRSCRARTPAGGPPSGMLVPPASVREEDEYKPSPMGAWGSMLQHYEALAVERAAETAAAEVERDRLRDALEEISELREHYQDPGTASQAAIDLAAAALAESGDEA